jgi:putative ABC transport system permease protein
MSLVKRALARLLATFRTHDLDRDFDEEAQSHIALATEDYVQRGVPLHEAQRRARVKFGSIAASSEVHRDSRGLPWLDGLWFDLRLALRGLRRDWAFTLAAIAMLTLGIGLNVTVFAIMDAMLFRGFPHVKQNDRLIYLQERSPSGLCCMSYADFAVWRAQAETFDGMAFVAGRDISLREGDGRQIDTRAFTVSTNTFALLGVRPMLGRDFAATDGAPGAAPVVILNYRFWENRFGRRPDVIGSTVYVNGEATTVIGVMPERFDFPTKENFWMPVIDTAELQQQRGLTSGGFTVVGRLRDGSSLHEARAELETINRRLEADFPETNRGVVPTVATHAEINSGRDAPLIWGSLFVAAWFVLLIACANLANLMLVRTVGRWREFSTRIALGAGQARMMRQLLAESLMLVSVAGTLGWWIITWSVHTWTTITESRYQVLDYRVDARTFCYLLAISVTAAVLCSLAPIGRVAHIAISGALRGDARGSTQDRRGKRLAAGLVAGQMALAIVLLSGAGVLVRSFVNIVSAASGVRSPETILVGAMRLPSDKYWSVETRRGYFDRIQARLKAIPGVEEASIASAIPVKYTVLRTFEIEGTPRPTDGDSSVQFLRAGPNYFRVLGASATAGRDFNARDHASSLPVAIVNESFAATYWPGEQSLGRRLRVKTPSMFGEWLTVVGVVPNIMQGDALRQQFKPLVYVPFQQEPAPRFAYFLLRTAVPPGSVAQAVRVEAQGVDPDVVLEDFETLEASFAFDRDFMDAEHSELGKHSKVAPIFALIALLLSAIGLSAVIAHSVTQRTKEIGVRIAIGAAAKDVGRMVLNEGMWPVAVGLLLGFAASLAVNRILQSQLVGVSPYDPVTLAGAPAVLIVVALLACQIPARRAMAVDPLVALRHE